MGIEIPLEKMTTSDKLRALEKIWEDLQRTADEIPSPTWHKDVLEAREHRYKDGLSKFLDWGHAKDNIRDKTS